MYPSWRNKILQDAKKRNENDCGSEIRNLVEICSREFQACLKFKQITNWSEIRLDVLQKFSRSNNRDSSSEEEDVEDDHKLDAPQKLASEERRLIDELDSFKSRIDDLQVQIEVALNEEKIMKRTVKELTAVDKEKLRTGRVCTCINGMDLHGRLRDTLDEHEVLKKTIKALELELQCINKDISQ